jgi:solute carrier family 25 2-oxodicarboxylate transporter 21
MHYVQTPQGKMFNNFVSGCVGGFIGTALNTPFDVVKSRIQSAGSSAASTASSASSSSAAAAYATHAAHAAPKYRWTYPALLTVAREEGVAALYKGFVPKVLRLGPGGGVLLLVVEATMGVFRKALGPPYE